MNKKIAVIIVFMLLITTAVLSAAETLNFDKNIVKTYDHDIGITQIISPAHGPLQTQAVEIVVKNYGSNSETTDVLVNITEIQGGTLMYVELVEDVYVLVSQEVVVEFPDWTPSETGKYQVTACTQLIGDENPNNDCLTKMINIVEEDEAVFIAHFMTLEGEPYQFDIIISDGEWVQEFENTTYIDTEVPCNASYIAIYKWDDQLSMTSFTLDIPLGSVKEVEVYAIDYSSITPLKPYFTVKEVGASVNLSWVYNESTGIFKLNGTTDKYISLGVCTDTDLSDTPQYMIMTYKENGVTTTPEDFFDINSPIKVKNWNFCKSMLESDGTAGGFVSFKTGLFEFEIQINVKWSNVVGVRGVTNNYGNLRPYDIQLEKVTGGEIYDPEFLYPQFYIPEGEEGNYIFQVFGLPAEYSEMSFPVDLVAEKYYILDAYPPKISNLELYSFDIAGEVFIGISNYSNLTHDTINKTIAVNIQNSLSDCSFWGYFVLPGTIGVKKLTAYVNETPIELDMWYDYTINRADEYNLVVVKIEPNVTKLKLEYIVDNPPNAPDIEGPTNGKAGTEHLYIFNSIDPEEDDIYYYIDWGDNNITWWFGPYASGATAIALHTWTEQGTYTIRAKALDSYGLESDWATLEVTMPKNKPVNFNFNLLSWLLERFPHIFPLLRQLLEL